jgi:hypothetical protein
VQAAPPPAHPAAPLDLLASFSRRDLDELAVRLYGRLRSELRSELLADRDRTSDLVDLWT